MKMKRARVNIARATLLSGLMLMGMMPDVSAAEKQPIPDFTKGGKPDENHDWNLGATGARGWVYGSKGQTAEARQILVTAVDAGSPAESVLRVNDVILGVNNQPFTEDARTSIASAITVAEQEKNRGVLKLIRWRDGQSANVEMKLAVLGSYSATAPYDCLKSKKIFEQGCQLIAKKGLDKASLYMDFNALALLATGKAEYHPMLAAYAKKVAESLRPGVWTWHYGYGNIFMAEYVLATGDQAILQELKRTAKEATMGQSVAGMWGHEFYTTASGNLNGYGCMNQPGIVQTIGLVLARQAGVKDPAVDQAIGRSARFLRWFVNKGAIPYGDHQPWPGHEDNGKCSSAAVLFDLLGDQEASLFFAKMSTAAYAERERGHTGNYFNVLWAMPGVSRGGPLATGAYMNEQSWYYDLARNWQGGFGYQGSPAGEEEHKKYTSWDSTGSYLMAYALPLKSLYLTGKKPCVVKPLSRDEVKDVILAGRDFFSAPDKNGLAYKGRTTEQLLAGLSSWSPAVRKRSAQTLVTCEGDFVPALLKLLASSRPESRYGACEALGYLGPKADAAAPQLRALLKDQDLWLQSLACVALAELGPEARKASVTDLLRMTVMPNPADPRRTAQRAACVALFQPFPGSRSPRTSILANSLEGVDMALLLPAMQSVLDNEDSVARGSLAHIYGKLTERDIAKLLPDIIKATQKLAPSNEMFADGIRLAGLDLLSRLHIREGMPLCVSVIEPARWGSGRRMGKCLELLRRYGVHAKEVLPQLKEMRQSLAGAKGGKKDENTVLFDKTIAEIEASQEAPTLVTVKEFVARSNASKGSN